MVAKSHRRCPHLFGRLENQPSASPSSSGSIPTLPVFASTPHDEIHPSSLQIALKNPSSIPAPQVNSPSTWIAWISKQGKAPPPDRMEQKQQAPGSLSPRSRRLRPSRHLFQQGKVEEGLSQTGFPVPCPEPSRGAGR